MPATGKKIFLNFSEPCFLLFGFVFFSSDEKYHSTNESWWRKLHSVSKIRRQRKVITFNTILSFALPNHFHLKLNKLFCDSNWKDCKLFRSEDSDVSEESDGQSGYPATASLNLRIPLGSCNGVSSLNQVLNVQEFHHFVPIIHDIFFDKTEWCSQETPELVSSSKWARE